MKLITVSRECGAFGVEWANPLGHHVTVNTGRLRPQGVVMRGGRGLLRTAGTYLIE
jgi:hypothetical protein